MDRIHTTIVTAITECLPARRRDVESLTLDELMDFMESQVTDEQLEIIQMRVSEIMHSTGEPPPMDVD